MVRLDGDRVRTRRWSGQGVELATVMAALGRLEAELTEHDARDGEHPHPRNCVLSLVVALGDRHRAEAFDRLIERLAASHPLRAIMVHVGGGTGPGGLDAEITVEAHRLVGGFPVQRERILLHVRDGAAAHLASMVQPLLVPDVPTYLWWARRQLLDEELVAHATSFSDVLVVDTARFEDPVGAVLQLAALGPRGDGGVDVADVRWDRLRPWRDSIGQFFAPADRRPFLSGLRELHVEAAGAAPGALVGAAMLAGWMATALGWRLAGAARTDQRAEAVAEAPAGGAHGQRVRIELRAVPHRRLHRGELLTVRLAGAGHAGRRPFTLAIDRDRAVGDHGWVEIVLDGAAPLRQRLALPAPGAQVAQLQVLLAAGRDPVLVRSLGAAAALLERIR